MIKHVSMLRDSYQAFGSSLASTIRHRFQRAGSLRCDVGVALEEHQIALVQLIRHGNSILSSLADRVATANDEIHQFAQLSQLLGHYHRQLPVSSVSVAISGARVLREPFDVPSGVTMLQIERFSATRAEQLGRQLGVDVCHDFYLVGEERNASAVSGRRGELVVCRRSTVDALKSAVVRATSAELRVVPECIVFSSIVREAEGGWLCWRRGRCYELLASGTEQRFVATASDNSPEQEHRTLNVLLQQAAVQLGTCVISVAGEPFLTAIEQLTHATGHRFAPFDMGRISPASGIGPSLDGTSVVALALANDAASSRSLVRAGKC
ncbi:hypothetical protein R84865_001199 [Carnimonas sp. R-84865]